MSNIEDMKKELNDREIEVLSLQVENGRLKKELRESKSQINKVKNALAQFNKESKRVGLLD